MSIPERFSASDYEESFSKFCQQGQFELAKLALEKAQSLRAAGDRSSKPTAPNPEQLEAVADHFEAMAIDFQTKADVARALAEQTKANNDE